MDREQIGLQLYAITSQLINDFKGTLRAVHDIGYREIEAPNFYQQKAGELRALFDQAGLNCISAHVLAFPFSSKTPSLQSDSAGLFAYCRELGLKYVVASLPPVPPRRLPKPEQWRDFGDTLKRTLEQLDREDWKWMTSFLDEKGREAKQYGLQLAYHNHTEEFRDLQGTTGFDELLRRTHPDLVKVEMDCAWVVAAGRDPVQYLEAHPGRFALLHVKDVKATAGTSMTADSVRLGEGVIDWRRLLAAARAAGTQRYYVEQEPPNDPAALDVARANYRYLTNLEAR